MLRLRVLAFFALTVLLLRCEEPVDLGVVIPESKLIVTSTMFADAPVVVQVQSYNGAISGAEADVIRDATVEIFAHHNEAIAHLPYVAETDGLYSTTDFRPRAGQTYQVRVYAPGYDLTFAESFVPPPSNLDTVSYSNLRPILEADQLRYAFDFGIGFADPEDEVNYYHLRLFQEIHDFTILANGDTSKTSSRAAAMIFKEPPVSSYRIAQSPGGILFIDNPFQETLIPVNTVSIDPERQLFGKIHAELRTVSSDYYLYEESISNTSVGINGGITFSNDIHSNVSNGGGNVSGYSSQTDSLSFGN